MHFRQMMLLGRQLCSRLYHQCCTTNARSHQGRLLKLARTEVALAGNRTRASRVAGENSTTEPPMLWALSYLAHFSQLLNTSCNFWKNISENSEIPYMSKPRNKNYTAMHWPESNPGQLFGRQQCSPLEHQCSLTSSAVSHEDLGLNPNSGIHVSN